MVLIDVWNLQSKFQCIFGMIIYKWSFKTYNLVIIRLMRIMFQ